MLLVADVHMLQCGWSESRFTNCRSLLLKFLKSCGFSQTQLYFVPLSALHGTNVLQPSVHADIPWWRGGTLMQKLVSADVPQSNSIKGALRVAVYEANMHTAQQQAVLHAKACPSLV